MVTEIAVLNVKAGLESRFELDFEIAGKYISSIKGYIRHSLSRCFEQPNKYVLFVEWKNIEAHTVGFRQSTKYLEWKKLLHHYYDPFPVVEHYETILEEKK